MKKFLAFFLALLTVVSMAPAVSAAPATTGQDIVPMADTVLPSSYSLVEHNENGTLPPIDDQGQIGSCVGQAVTYMQFSNAVARYMQEIKGNKNWKPNDGSEYGDDRYLFSPKWTLNYSGAGTQWVYDIILHMGVPTQTQSKFFKGARGSIDKNASLYYQYVNGKKVLYTETTSWDVTGTVMQDALNYRLAKYEQIWTRNVGGGQITTTVAGKQLIEKIKTSILNGNVVVTGGPSGKWSGTYRKDSVGKLTGNGTIGKAGEYCCFAAQGNYGGGHQVSIVGWDDNVVFTRNGVTMKGAFLVANSWATSWMNDGYLWFMYDSINKKSEFAAQDATLNQSTRDYSLDQFCFTDWHDVEIGHPDLMISAEVTTKDREGTSLLLTRTDKESGETKTYQPRIFYYGDNNNHETYDVKAPDYLNYAGVVNGEDATANFTFSYEDLYDSIPSGKTQNDYVWGFRLIVEKGNTAKVGKVTLQDKKLTKLFEKTFNVTVPAENYEAQAYISCSSDCYIIPETSNMYTMTPAAGSKSPVKAGGSYSFTVTPSKGFTLQYASVLANGRVLTPDDNGVYTVENIQSSVAISVSNIVEDASYKKFNPSMYNSDGWEYWGNQYLMVVQISTSELRKDLYADPNKVGTENYPYYFRFTDQKTGTSYYMQPSSFYDFGSSILYRLPFLNAGFSAKLDHVYSFTVDVLYQGHVLYTGTIKNTKCNFADDNADPNKNPPQKNNDTIVPSKDVHTVTYLRDGKKVGTDAFVEGSPIVNRAAVSNPEFKAVFSPALPETMGSANITATVAGAVYSLGDINGDGSVNVKDLSRLCLYLADNSTKCDAALVDANGDGSVKIDDVTYLIDKFSTSVTIEL